MRFLIFLIIFLSLLICGIDSCAAADVPDYCVRVYAHKDIDDIYDGLGSGSLISPTLVVTAHHVVKGVRPTNHNVDIRFNDERFARGKVVAVSVEHDLAVVRIPTTTHEPVDVAKAFNAKWLFLEGFASDYLYKKSLAPVLYRINKVNGSKKDEAQGYVTFKKEANGVYVFSGAVSRQGDSGGPATNARGELIGVILSTNKAEKLTAVATIDLVRELLASLLSDG